MSKLKGQPVAGFSVPGRSEQGLQLRRCGKSGAVGMIFVIIGEAGKGPSANILIPGVVY
jgi:hypothetical protein